MKLFKIREIRRKLFFTFLIVIVFRLLAHIPVPGVDILAIRNFLQSSAIFGFFDLFSGGGFQNFSIATLGLAPYINASIIIQMLTVLIPSWEELSKEGEFGREKLNLYTRLLTLPLALIQSYGIYFLLQKQNVITTLPLFDLILLVLTLTGGSLFLVWIGELVTEHGVGNGISLLIFVSIISRLPITVYNLIGSITFDNIFNVVIFSVVAIMVLMAVILVNEGTKNIVIEYGRTGQRSQKVTNFLPIKINQAGVIPIIFSFSVVMLPSLIAGPLQNTNNNVLISLGEFLAFNFSSQEIGYNILHFFLVLAFTYFYTFIQFNPEKIADDVKKRGGFIPGVRPGVSTTRYLRSIVNKTTLAGGVFLGIIAIMPFIVQKVSSVSIITIGGTSLLIAVSVVLETIRQVESLMVSRSYDKFLR